MSEQTHADIIAEMRGADNKCQLATKDGTGCYHCPFGSAASNCVFDNYADRLDAAHKREVDALKQRLAELNAEIAAKDAVIMRLNDALAEEQRRKMATAEKSSAVGNAAKLREALIKAVTMLAVCEWPDGTNMEGVEEVSRDIDAAFDVPPRNCDRFGGDIEKLREACLRERGLNPDEDFPEIFCEWLLAETKKGGAK